MRIYIRTNEGRRFRFPIPIGLVRFGLSCGNFGVNIAKKHVDEQTLKYLECIDFKALSVCFKELKYYKGLKIIDVKSSTGEEVTIIV